MKKAIIVIALTVFFGVPTTSLAQQVHFVKADAGGTGDGTSWINAYPSLQDALSAAVAGDEIWVAAGQYLPDQGLGLTPGDRSLSFELKSGVRMHGSFEGTESSRGDRNPIENRTILSGDLSNDDAGFSMRIDNSFHVVRATGVDDATLLEAFVITGGLANGSAADSLGGSILVDGGQPWIVNTLVSGSEAYCGGGIATMNGAVPLLVNTIVNGNRAGLGGGLCNLDSSPELINATITANSASVGAGIYNSAASPRLANSIVSHNRTYEDRAHCEIWQYPCTLGDVSPEIEEQTNVVMAEALDVLKAGTVSDAVDYLNGRSDVVQVLRNDYVIGLRIQGGTMSYITKAASLVDSGPGKKSSVPGFRNIVGEDWNGDGNIDNRDKKKALIVAPFETPDADLMVIQLLDSRDYFGQIVKQGRYLEPYNLDAFSQWNEFDYIYLSTPHHRLCEEGLEGLHLYLAPSSSCAEILWTGVPITITLRPEPGIRVLLVRDEAVDAVGNFLVLTRPFFQHYYPEGLDNAILHCASCELGEDELSPIFRIFDVNGGVIGWTRPTSILATAPANVLIIGEMLKGRTMQQGVERIGPTQIPLQGSDGSETGVTELIGHRAPIDRPIPRLIDLPSLYDPETATLLTDGREISRLIDGTVGDSEADDLKLELRLKGYNTDTDFSDVSFSYFVNDEPVTGNFDMTDKLGVSGRDYEFGVRHTLDLPQPVQSGALRIDVVAELPDGSGESRFSVTPVVDGFVCSIDARIEGYRDGGFSGPAGFTISPTNTEVALSFESFDWTTRAYLEDGYDGVYHGEIQAAFNVIAPVEFATINHPVPFPMQGSWNNSFLKDHSSLDCDDCGGTVVIDSLSSDGLVLYGEVKDFVSRDSQSSNADLRLSTMNATFRAFRGLASETSSPYGQCLEQYWTADLPPDGILSKK